MKMRPISIQAMSESAGIRSRFSSQRNRWWLAVEERFPLLDRETPTFRLPGKGGDPLLGVRDHSGQTSRALKLLRLFVGATDAGLIFQRDRTSEPIHRKSGSRSKSRLCSSMA